MCANFRAFDILIILHVEVAVFFSFSAVIFCVENEYFCAFSNDKCQHIILIFQGAKVNVEDAHKVIANDSSLRLLLPYELIRKTIRECTWKVGCRTFNCPSAIKCLTFE